MKSWVVLIAAVLVLTGCGQSEQDSGMAEACKLLKKSFDENEMLFEGADANYSAFADDLERAAGVEAIGSDRKLLRDAAVAARKSAIVAADPYSEQGERIVSGENRRFTVDAVNKRCEEVGKPFK